MDEYNGYEKAEFGDERLSKRLAIILDQLASDPTASISAACRDPHQAKAVYRFLGNDDVTTEAITEITRNVTLESIFEAKPSVVLMPQDTTSANFSSLKETVGLGNIGSSKSALGIEVHSSIAIGETGEIYGLLAQKLWTRPPEDFGKSDASRKNLPIEDKESFKWLETLERVGSSFPEGTLAVHVCDREGDIFELFAKAEKDGVNYLCRRSHNRSIEEEDGMKKLDSFFEFAARSWQYQCTCPAGFT